MKGINVYRLVLLMLIVGAIGTGVWYCYRCRVSNKGPEDATLVDSMGEAIKDRVEEIA